MESPKNMKVSTDMAGSKDLEAVESKAVGEVLPVDGQDAALLRKIDWRIVPIMFFCYFLQFLDKVLINYANVMGLATDLGLEGQDFSWMATAFFIAYAVAEFPQGFLLQRFPLAKVLGFNVLCWGITVCCSAAAQNFAGMVALRTLLGCFEAVISPALVLSTAQWYTKREAGPRYGIWYCGLGAGQIVGGLVSFAAQHGPKDASFGGWRIMMVSVGVFNIGVACVVLLFLPDNVNGARFLSADEKASIHRKLALDQGGNGAKVFKPAALGEVFQDVQIWLLLLLTILIVIPSGVITTFSATLIRGFGYGSKQSALLNMPSGVISIVSTLLCTFAILRGFPRWLSIVLLLVPTVIGAGLMSFISTDNQAGKLAGIYLINTIVAPLAIIYSWVGSNVASYTKRVAANAIVAIGFSIANIIGPQTFQARDAPGYLPAKITIFGVAGGAMIISVVLRGLYGFRNRKTIQYRQAQLDEFSTSPGLSMEQSDEFQDQTDRANKAFVYVY
jgi:sugar phosphate permease